MKRPSSMYAAADSSIISTTRSRAAASYYLLLLLLSPSIVAGQPTSTSNGYYCGASWADAVSSCLLPCPSGAPSDCPIGETCFAGTPCVASTPVTTPSPMAMSVASPTATASTTIDGGVDGGTSGGGVGTCGDGTIGDGKCANPSDCCSMYGYCGTEPEHCESSSTGMTATMTTTTTGGMEGTCGGGSVGNGICPNNAECCSPYGFCGTTSEHCDVVVGQEAGEITAPTPTVVVSSENNSPQFDENGFLIPALPTQQIELSSPQAYGTCGNGDTGNGICPLNSDCCSSTGFCGVMLEHCTNKVGPVMPGQPDYTGTSSPAGEVVDATISTGATTTTATTANDQQQQSQGDPTSGGVLQELLQTGEGQGGGGAAQPTTSTATINIAHGTDKRIIGYYAGWQWYDRDKLADPVNMDFRKVQRVNYAFFQPDVSGNIYGTDRWGDPQVLFGPYVSMIEGGTQRCSYDGPAEVNCAYHAKQRGLIHKAHAEGAEVYPSIGGWTLSDNFPAMSADPTARDAFARKCVEILSYYDFDGIDIDWEYPGYADHSGTPADRENFTTLLYAIREALEMHTRETGKVYGLTAALPCAPDNIANIEVDKLVNVLSEFNLMSYDFFGAWDGVTGTNAPLYNQGFGNEEFNVDRCVENYVALGVPRDKINIGLPFYGRSFKFASKLNQIHGGSDLANWPEDDGTPQYFNIRAKLPFMTQVRDNKSKTQYAYVSHTSQQGGQDQQQQSSSPPGGRRSLADATTDATTSAAALTLPEGLVSFDDERAICDKVHYAHEKELGGFIVWELSGDVLGDLSTPLLDVANMKLANPSFECCTLHSEEECEKERLEAEQLANSQWSGGYDYGGWTSSSGLEENGVERRDWSSSIIIRLSAAFVAATALLFW